MSLSAISIKNVRNLDDIMLSFSPSLNFIWGENASGKTSLLEAVYLLATGRSFRTRHIDNIIRQVELSRELVVFGKMSSFNGADEITVGVRKSTLNGSEIRISGQSVKSAAVLAKLIPVLLVEPPSFNLLTGAPKVRRQFIDWGVFHVEHRFSFLWNDYINCLKQRNSLLRTAKIDKVQLKVWDKRIALLGEQITQHRCKFMATFQTTFEKVIRSLGPRFVETDIKLKFYQGWDKAKSLAESLELSRTKDIERKYTQYGPHRADLKLRIAGKNVSEFLSRGQQKLLIIALYISHVKCLRELNQSQTLVLIDDIAAELDSANIEIILCNLLELDAQVMCTVLDREIAKNYLDNQSSNCKMFHVEHGRLQEYDYQEKQL